MNNLLLILSSIISIFGGINDCIINRPEYVYDLPDNFRVMHTLEKNGLLGVIDEFDNGMEVYVSYPLHFDMEVEICMLQKSRSKILEERRYEDGSYKVSIDDPGPIYPYDEILIIPKEGYVIRAYFFYNGDPKTHGAFEERAVKLARSIAHGGRDGNAFESCFVGVLASFNLLNFGEGRSANVPAIPVR